MLKTTVICLPYFETVQKDLCIPGKLLFSLSLCFAGVAPSVWNTELQHPSKPCSNLIVFPAQGQEPSLPSSLSMPIIRLYLTFPIVTYSCHRGYWWLPQESLASNPCPLKASGWNGSLWGAFSGPPPSHVHSMSHPWFCFTLVTSNVLSCSNLSIFTWYLKFFLDRTGCQCDHLDYISMRFPPPPSVSSLTVLAPLLHVLHEGKSYLRSKLLSSVLVLDTSIFVPPLIKRLCLRLFLYIICNPELSHVMPGEPCNQKG